MSLGFAGDGAGGDVIGEEHLSAWPWVLRCSPVFRVGRRRRGPPAGPGPWPASHERSPEIEEDMTNEHHDTNRTGLPGDHRIFRRRKFLERVVPQDVQDSEAAAFAAARGAVSEQPTRRTPPPSAPRI